VGVGSIAERGVRDGRWRPAAAWHDIAAEPSAAIVAVLVVLGGALRFYGLNHQGFWYDEANSDFLVRHPLGQMLGLLPATESTPPLYYILAWFWTRIFGTGEAGLRSLSALFGVLLIPVAYALGKAAVTRRVGLVLAALVAFNPMLIWYSQEARSYSLLILLTAVALLALVWALRTPEPRAFAIWAVASILALTSHYYAILAVAPMALWLLVHYGRRRAAQVAVAVVTACGAALIPLALSQNSTHHDQWISRHPLGLRLSQILPQVVIGPSAPDRVLLKFIGFAAAAIALVLLVLRGDAVERRPAALTAALVVTGFVLNLLLILLGYDDLITRNLLALIVAALLVLAAGLGARRAGYLGLLTAAVLCALGITAAVGVASDRILQRPDWRPVARTLGPAPHGPGRVILIQKYQMLLPLSLYMPGLRRIAPKTGVIANQFDVIAISAPRVPTFCWWGAACNLIPSRPQAAYRIAGFRFVWRRQVRQFTVEHFAARHPVRPSTIAHALTGTVLGNDDFLYQR
jgi:mannosyltransferase